MLRITIVEFAAAVAVLEANNVVFAEVLSALHFNQFHGDSARVAEAVFTTHRHVGALVLLHQ